MVLDFNKNAYSEPIEVNESVLSEIGFNGLNSLSYYAKIYKVNKG